MRAFPHVALLSMFVVCAPADGAEPPPTIAQTATIDRAVAAELTRQHVPGIAVAIGRDGDVVYSRGFGLRDVRARAPVDATTVFEIGSITKQFTAAAVMQLVQAEKIRLDAPIATYLAGVPAGDRITVRELLTHTSGLPNYTDVPNFFTTIAPRRVAPSGLLALVANQPLAFAPGTQWAYSNTNYAVLGMLVAKVSGESYPAYVQSHVIAAAGLATTRYSATYLDGPNDALPYEDEAGTPTRLKPIDLDWAYAAGALWSDAPDLVRWQHALFSGRIVDATSLAAMTTPAVLPNGTSTDYGFGLIIENYYGVREIFHNGGLPGYSSRDAYFPDQHLEIAVLGNEIFDPAPIVRDVAATLVPTIGKQIAAAASATPAPGEDAASTALARSLLVEFQRGTIDHSRYDATANAAFTNAIVASVAAQLGPLGPPTSVIFVSKKMIGLERLLLYRVVWPSVTLAESIALDPDGKVGGIYFKPDTGAESPPSALPSPSPSAPSR